MTRETHTGAILAADAAPAPTDAIEYARPDRDGRIVIDLCANGRIVATLHVSAELGAIAGLRGRGYVGARYTGETWDYGADIGRAWDITLG